MRTGYPNVREPGESFIRRGRRLGMRGAMLTTVMLATACADKASLPRQLAGADPARGLATIERSACGACHTIPGTAWPQGQVGGALAGFGERALIAGRFPNQPDVLVQWLRDPPSLSPETGMPPTVLTDSQARDVAAYLYTLGG